MSDPVVTGLRSAEFAVPDVAAAANFYVDCWGLDVAAEDKGSVYLRGTGAEHHSLVLREGAEKKLLAVNLAADDKAAVDGLYDRAKAMGMTVTAPEDLSGPAGGYGFVLNDLHGRDYRVSTGLKAHEGLTDDPGKPRKLSHVVMNSPDRAAQSQQFIDMLGFKLTDRTGYMDFIRCSSDHHAIAYTTIDTPTLNHCAFEMPSHDALMHGSGRMKRSGHPVEWGIGRHGPGNNIFAYFVDPNNYVIEYTAEVEQVDENYKVGMPEDWERPQEYHGDNWGYAEPASDRMRANTR
jgi:catechol-2,3-dioxygenase|tara:strand:- start:34 stop:909 length:876 start_codon:yes stop_codon:yes gene_type:complete